MGSSALFGFRIRWAWVVVVLVAVNLVGLGWIWLISQAMRQDQFIHSVTLCGGSCVLVLAWIGLVAPWPRRRRLGIVGAVVGLVVVACGLLRIRGVSGDMVPLVTWRWEPVPDTQLSMQVPVDLAAPAAAPIPAHRDYPQFLGPDRNAHIAHTSLFDDWSARPPRLIWRQAVGAGWSAFAVSGSRAVTQEQRGDDEVVVCYDLFTGQMIWDHHDRARYENTLAGIGPRATPTIDADRVYTVGATGILNCLALNSGQLFWSRQILQENGATLNTWGTSGSPLILDQLVVVNAGGPDGRSLVAYDKMSGERIWSAGSAQASYSSPMRATLAGTLQILILNQDSVTGHDPVGGTILWTHPWPGRDPKVAQPVLLPGDRVLLTSSYGVGCEVIQVRSDPAGRFSAQQVWKNLLLKAKFTNVVVHGRFVYGLDEGSLVCLEFETGQRRWKGARYGHGQLMLVGDLLLVQSEAGQIVLVAACPDAPVERARLVALRGKCWNNPALAGPYLLLRDDQEAACYQLPLCEEPAS